MNVFDEIRVELGMLSDLELLSVARDQYGLDVEVTDPRREVIEQCVAVEQHNFFA
jgi:hypothetical protein